MNDTSLEQKVNDFIIDDKIIELNLGIIGFKERQIVHELCHKNQIHTYSHTIQKWNDDNEPIKEVIISKEPIKIEDKSLKNSIIGEIKFLLKINVYCASIEELYKYEDEAKINHFLYQYSLLFSNNFGRLSAHRKEITLKARDELNKMTIPSSVKPRALKNVTSKKFFIIENASNEKRYVRFDMINAVSSVIGIKDWSGFMKKFTQIELYTTSKSLRGQIMKDIHQKCMSLVDIKTRKMLNRLMIQIKYECTFLYVHVDEIIIDYNDNINYNEVKEIIDPNNDYRMNIFTLTYHSNDTHKWYIEKDVSHEDKCIIKNKRPL